MYVVTHTYEHECRNIHIWQDHNKHIHYNIYMYMNGYVCAYIHLYVRMHILLHQLPLDVAPHPRFLLFFSSLLECAYLLFVRQWQ